MRLKYLWQKKKWISYLGNLERLTGDGEKISHALSGIDSVGSDAIAISIEQNNTLWIWRSEKNARVIKLPSSLVDLTLV